MAATGDFQWPPMGRFPCPPSALQTSVALAALRRRESPIRPVVAVGAVYWIGASIAWVIGSNAANMTDSERPFSLEDYILGWSWTWAVIFTAVIASVTSGVRAWQVRN